MSKPTKDRTARESSLRFLLLGVVGALSLIWLLTAVLESPSKPDNFTNSYSGSPGGHLALHTLIDESGRDVQRTSKRLTLPTYDGWSDSGTLAILEPRVEHIAEFDDELPDLIKDWEEDGGNLLIVMPKRFYYQSDQESEDGSRLLVEHWIPISDVNDVIEFSRVDDRLGVKRTDTKRQTLNAFPPSDMRVDGYGNRPSLAEYTMGDEYEAKPWRSVKWKTALQYFFMVNDEIDAHYTVLWRTSLGQPVAIEREHDMGQGRMILVSDPDLFTNRYLGRDGAGDSVMLIFDRFSRSGPVTFDEALHGFYAEPSLEYTATRPPWLWITLAALLVLGVIGWRQATVVRPIPDREHDRRSRTYAIEGLARFMYRARGHHAAGRKLLRLGERLNGDSVDVHAAWEKNSEFGDDKNTKRIERLNFPGDEDGVMMAAAYVRRKFMNERDEDDNDGT